MQGHYPFEFDREMGCSASEYRPWLPAASGGREIEWHEDGAVIGLDTGSVLIEWRTGEPRRIAAITLPRLLLRVRARDIDEAAWQRFMRYFDLYLQRGGG